ncbi:hypothetical protein DYH09_12195 [bacterium CPR1]|nr:hypothetical protein [bacterium CPR1]
MLLLSLSARSETLVRSLENNSDAPTRVRLGQTEVATIDRYEAGVLRLELPQGDPNLEGAPSLELETRAGVTRLYDYEGKIFARIDERAPVAISSRSNQYLTLIVDEKGNVLVRRWEYWYR